MRLRTGTLLLLAFVFMMISAIISRTQQPGTTVPGKPVSAHGGGSVAYTNRLFGFRFDLPSTWKGFRIVAKTWNGGDGHGQQDLQHGPLILIRHPLWSEADPREDIPIMVSTLAQWEMIEKETLIVSAAPIPPAEIGRNRKYVFATPPRYSFNELKGVDEVVNLINHGAMHPMQPSVAH